jgi:hypothetical protein
MPIGFTGIPTRENKMNRYNELKLKVLSLFATIQGEWLGPNEAAERLDFSPARSAWTYFKRLWSFGLLEGRSRGRGTLEYRISELGRSRLRWLRSQGSCFSK